MIHIISIPMLSLYQCLIASHHVKNSLEFVVNLFITLSGLIFKKYITLSLINKFFLLSILIILFSCGGNNIPAEGTVNARIIEYRVTYLQDKAGSIPTALLPTRMTVTFAGHYAITRIDGLLGQFSLSYIANLRNRSVITMVKFFDKKLVNYGKPGEPPVSIEPIESIKITEQEGNIEFAGFDCKKLLITSSNNDTFLVFCTDQIKVRNPNATTCFKDIDKVLLKFNTTLDLLDMQLNAERYIEKEVPWETFRVPDDYSVVSREDMERVIEQLLK